MLVRVRGRGRGRQSERHRFQPAGIRHTVVIRCRRAQSNRRFVSAILLPSPSSESKKKNPRRRKKRTIERGSREARQERGPRSIKTEDGPLAGACHGGAVTAPLRSLFFWTRQRLQQGFSTDALLAPSQWPDKAWQGPRPAHPRHSALRGPALQAMALETAHCGPVLWAAPRRNKRCTTVPQYVPSPPPGGRFRDTLDTTLRRRAWRWSEWSTTSATLGPTLGEGSCLLRRLAAPEFSCPPGVTTRDRARRQRCPSPPGRSRPSFT